jgi:hypothetical protein
VFNFLDELPARRATEKYATIPECIKGARE